MRAECCQPSKWYNDSGATSHMSSDKHFFTTHDAKNIQMVILQDGQVFHTQGSSEGILCCDHSTSVPQRVLFQDKLLVLQPKENLLSTKKLTAWK
jgi:hypothetical protein